MPKGWGDPQPSRSPMIICGSSFMVPGPAATPTRSTGNRCGERALKVMATGPETRTEPGEQVYGALSERLFISRAMISIESSTFINLS